MAHHQSPLPPVSAIFHSPLSLSLSLSLIHTLHYNSPVTRLNLSISLPPFPCFSLFWVLLFSTPSSSITSSGGVGVSERRRWGMEEEEEEQVIIAKADGGTVGTEVRRRVRVLVVDDSHVDRKIVERLLLRSGLMFDVITVESGKKAMEVLGLKETNAETPAENDSKLDIVLTDYCMPEMNGYDLLKALKENSSFKTIPVVIMSSENDPQRINRCLSIGAEAFMIKPLRIEDVERLRNYAKTSASPAPKVGTKRKLPLDSITDGNESERRPRLAGVAVA